MAFTPRLLCIEDERQGHREILRIGADPSGAERMAAKMVRTLIKIQGVSCRAANILKQEMLAIGGDAAVARGSVSCAIPETDVILIGSLKTLRQLCRRLPSQPFGLAELAADIGRLLQRLDHPPLHLEGRSCRLSLQRPLVMGILNVTPDSFSDGGCFASPERALQRARQMVEEGADIIDVGGESTRPGAPPVALDEELDRVVPIVKALRRDLDVPVSVDTTKAVVAREAVAAGAEFVNDVSGLRFDPEMAETVARGGAGLFLMHTRGRPEQMQSDTRYGDLLGEICDYLEHSLKLAREAGVSESKIALDPGIGFGKDLEGNLEILRRLGELRALGRPILLGTSRKSFVGTVLGRKEPGDRLSGTLATVALGVAQGARIFRVHDVGPAREAALMASAVCWQEQAGE
ncbi:MAG: dihydropteroate synthase [Desulfuromonas sp.]|uniref:dihydropteroate synthase n=1 Tax=Desulfuromonas sp. TaxID=892 RepID=UPI000CB6A069|nr:dihydropteroate synthase [Desulfuromonas sp.]PLX83613.1 MAG: dihydropteroate synthase [Desulfuromonas sp.]